MNHCPKRAAKNIQKTTLRGALYCHQAIQNHNFIFMFTIKISTLSLVLSNCQFLPFYNLYQFMIQNKMIPLKERQESSNIYKL